MSVTPSESTISSLARKRVEELLGEGKRLDGRELTQCREFEVETDLIGTAEGSAQVKLGKTIVLVGIKAGTGEPFPDTPDQGVLTVNAELVPIASPNFETGPPREGAIELARVVDRSLRESKIVDLEKLCLVPGKAVYVIFVDIYVLNHDGNLIDASVLAALSALMKTKLPKYTAKKDGTVTRKSGHSELKIQNMPISLTTGKIGESLLFDPSLEEEEIMDSRITMTFDSEGNVRAMQKGGHGVFTTEELKTLVSTAGEKTSEIRDRLKELIK
ncbi:MAG: exosome complex protein Rrp42 [Candidatus Bathyarchaeota archaeon]|nr:MAG: exosome complex protein Rrp42 [Candidatus Bathyarchaeota archaeon]